MDPPPLNATPLIAAPLTGGLGNAENHLAYRIASAGEW